MTKVRRLHKARVLKLVHGGQGLCELESGQKALVWGVLPGEEVEFQVTKSKKGFLEGVVTDVITSSPERILPQEKNYLSTSPWQILKESKESAYKLSITQETFERAGVELPKTINVHETASYYHYRNKMEYSFYGDENGLHLALFNRGTHQKQIVTSSKIARKEIDITAQAVCQILLKNNIRAGSLKSLIVRCSQDGNVVCGLFVKEEDFPEIEGLNNLCQGIAVIFSNPKSPASIITKVLYEFGNQILIDKIVNHNIQYDVNCFFQVNIPEFTKALDNIKNHTENYSVVDMYCGVGSIGVATGKAEIYIESDPNNISHLKVNAGKKVRVINSKGEAALDYIDTSKVLIVDPPRAGLHLSLVNKLNEVVPEKILYLSCNPSTQARDIALLQQTYTLRNMDIYNFFPRTPHIETLAELVRR